MNEEEKEVLDLLLTKLPEFKVTWNKFSDYEIRTFDEKFDPCLYEVASVFSQSVIEQFHHGNHQFLLEAFTLIEKLESHPNENISECAMVGFIEGVLMLRSHEGIALNAFDAYLGLKSRNYWYAMHDFFTGRA